MSSLSPSPIKIMEDYTKLGRSSCKKYSKPIISSALRLGLVSKDPRRFDMTKWHHLDCFPSESVSSTEVNKMDEKEDDKLEQGNLKKQKLHTSEKRTKLPLEIAMSDSDIKDKYKDAILSPRAFQTIIFLERDDGLHDSTKIAAFDFDGCLAKTSVKRCRCMVPRVSFNTREAPEPV